MGNPEPASDLLGVPGFAILSPHRLQWSRIGEDLDAAIVAAALDHVDHAAVLVPRPGKPIDPAVILPFETFAMLVREHVGRAAA